MAVKPGRCAALLDAHGEYLIREEAHLLTSHTSLNPSSVSKTVFRLHGSGSLCCAQLPGLFACPAPQLLDIA